MKRLAILGYHKIGPPPRSGWDTWFYIPEQTFLRQLSELQAGGWQVVDLATFLHGLSSPDFLPERSALITFDDGYRSMLTITLPLLQRLGLPSVLFVPTDHVGKSNSFDSGSEPDEIQSYIQGSKGEFSAAKPLCIRLRNAWISDRSICYLASGKPVIVEDTGPREGLNKSRRRWSWTGSDS